MVLTYIRQYISTCGRYIEVLDKNRATDSFLFIFIHLFYFWIGAYVNVAESKLIHLCGVA